MPAPHAQAISTAARQYFTAQGIHLPMQWRPLGDLYPRAFTEPEIRTPATGPGSLFQAPTRNKYHTGAANMMAGHYEQYLDAVSEAIAGAIDKWMRLASVVAITMAGSLGIWRPGGVSSPALAPLILAAAPRQTPGDRKYSQAIAAALGDHWQIWHQGLSGPLSYPGYTGAPMPNTPAPLITLMSAGESALAPQSLSRAMQRRLNDAGALHAVALFDALAHGFYTHFQVFKTSTLVTGVTVAGGAVIPTPGNFV